MLARLLTAFALALTLVAGPTAADELAARLKFWDDGLQDASFVKFRDALKATLAHKDAKALMKIVAPNIQNSFDAAENGAAKFRKGWKPEDATSAIWPALALVVNLGGNFDSKTEFSAPYVFSAFPSDLDGFDKVVVTKEGAVMRAQAKPEAPIVQKLDHDILTVVSTATVNGGITVGFAGLKPQHEARPDDWVLVQDAKKNLGAVLAADVRSPIDYRATFEKRKGRWLMTSFLAGD